MPWNMSGQAAKLTWVEPEPLPKGLDAVAHGVSGVWQRRSSRRWELDRDASAVDALAPQFCEMRDHDLRQELLKYRDEFRRGGRESEANLLRALAGLREAADRKLGLRPFKVQLMGALALHRGFLAEMATGEGKTLTAGLAAILAGWTRKPTHVITVNDYLVERDVDWLKTLYEFAGIRAGTVTGAMAPADRRRGYGADITYTTSKELLADFLRDRITLGTVHQPCRRLIRQLLVPRTVLLENERLVLRGLHTVIVDEADSVLIDEAVTPLIISSPRKNEALRTAALEADALASCLERGVDFQVDARHREVEITPAGEEKIAERCKDREGLWRGRDRRNELLRQALTAREYFLLGKQYVVDQGKIVIVDEFTGRPMPQRSWRQGLHQAVEAKEGVELTDPTETIARQSFQRFFRSFHRVCGMTGTAREASSEFWNIYKLPVVRIPTNMPCVRKQWPNQYFPREESKWTAIVKSIQEVHSTGRPILVGTRSVSASEKLAVRLGEAGLDVKVLNATRLAEEAVVVAMAGERGRITIATNMAGRGTDIKLGAGVAELGGLHVIATEHHESGRVDRQLIGRSARQGDPGSAQQFASAEDELVKRFLPKPMVQSLKMATGVLGGALFDRAQSRAQAMAYRQRQNVLRSDTWLDESLAFTTNL